MNKVVVFEDKQLKGRMASRGEQIIGHYRDSGRLPTVQSQADKVVLLGNGKTFVFIKESLSWNS